VSAGPDPTVPPYGPPPPYGSLPAPQIPPPPASFEEWRQAQGLPPLEAPATFAAPTGWRAQVRKATAPIGAGLAALWKLKVFLVIAKLKFLGVAVSMAVSVAAYAWIFGWTFALGFVLLIFVHEMGHVIVLRLRGIRSGLPVFVPFLGAFVSMKETPRTVYDEALSGIAGPAFGAAAAALVWWQADSRGSAFLLALAYTGFLLNLFNLLPVLPLDGGRTAAALHPATWAVGLLGLLLLFF
jgi:Zn-dependent protease